MTTFKEFLEEVECDVFNSDNYDNETYYLMKKAIGEWAWEEYLYLCKALGDEINFSGKAVLCYDIAEACLGSAEMNRRLKALRGGKKC